METGVLFADIRGFTSLSERTDPAAVSTMLRRFYTAAEDVLFPEAVIDKLIGDEVMALYLPYGGRFDDAEGLDEGEERPRKRRRLGARLNLAPVDLLAERARPLEHRAEVGLLLGHRHQLRDHHVL